MLTAERIRELLDYNPETGVFLWRENAGKRRVAGSVAGYPRAKGYWGMCLDGENCYAHRVAWLYVYGRWPEPFVDHINHDKRDNRIANLREVTNSQNMHNLEKSRSNTGVLGVNFDSKRKKFQAQFAYSVDGRQKRFHRRFENLEDAAMWLEEKRKPIIKPEDAP